MPKKTKKSAKTAWKILFAAVVLAGLAGGFVGLRVYRAFTDPSVTAAREFLHIPTGAAYADVLRTLRDGRIVRDVEAFDFVARKMKYPGRVKPGRYRLTDGMTNRALVSKLRRGDRDAVRFRFQNIRLKEHFAGILGRHFEADSQAFSRMLNDTALAESYGFTADDFFCMFIPDTYEIHWNTPPEKIISRFRDEYHAFWNKERRKKAALLDLSPQQVGVLASIVKGEAMHVDEMPAIAGLYLNRLEKGMRLQADPTVIFANNDFSIRRVLNKHLTIDHPYNTYRRTGLPPGPIMLPSIASIDAVLNAQKHDYIFMCAKEDFSGYHNFARTMAEHAANARKFQKALDERNIRK